MSKKDNWEHTVHKPIRIKFEKGTEIAIHCSECKAFMIYVKEPIMCQSCNERIDKCKHGIACQKCSRRLMLEWIRGGNMKIDDTPQLEAIKEMIWEEYKLEVLIDAEGYLVIKGD